MADGKIVIAVDADAKKAQKELDTLSAKIDKMEAKLNGLNKAFICNRQACIV